MNDIEQFFVILGVFVWAGLWVLFTYLICYDYLKKEYKKP